RREPTLKNDLNRTLVADLARGNLDSLARTFRVDTLDCLFPQGLVSGIVFSRALPLKHHSTFGSWRRRRQTFKDPHRTLAWQTGRWRSIDSHSRRRSRAFEHHRRGHSSWRRCAGAHTHSYAPSNACAYTCTRALSLRKSHLELKPHRRQFVRYL